MAPLSSSFNGFSTRAEGFISSFIAKVYDGFARVTTGSLGTATLGQVWVQNNGVWTSNNGVAITLTAASNYSYATVPFKTNGTISAQSVSQGAGVIFWQSGANDWWAATTSGTSGTYISSYTCNANSCCTGSNNCQSSTCCTGSNNCTYSATCGAGATPDSYYAGKYDACCTTKNTCQASYSCGATSYAGSPNPCCTGSNNCVSVTYCAPSASCGSFYYAGTYNACCDRNTHNQCIASASCGASYYAGTYNACCQSITDPCASGSNTCQSDPNCGATSYAGTYDPCCSGSYAACQSSTTCGASYTKGSYYSGAPSTCCTGSNNCTSNACCTGSNNCASNNCCTQTANYSTSYDWILKIIKSVSGTVSTVTSNVLATTYSNTNGIKGIKVTTSGTGVSAQGYSDNALTTTVGSPVTATAPSQPTGTGVGIILTPGGTNQGNSVGPFTAQ